MIRIRGLKKVFKNFTLEIDDLLIGQGDYIVILGNSGSGKTLLLEIMAGLINSDSGSIIMDGKDLNLLSIQKRPFGLVFQDQALFPHMNVRENISYALKSSGFNKEQVKAKTQELANRMEVVDLLDRNIAGLSGGEKQRIALARTLAKEPICLLLDEPLSALDVRLRKEIRAVLRWLNRAGVTILHVTHDFEEAINLATHIGVMEDGQLVQYGHAEQILREPRSPFVANFTGIRNYFKVDLILDERSGEVIAWTENKIPIQLSTNKTAGKGFIIIPCESIVLSQEQVHTSAANQFVGQITDISPGRYGLEIHIEADLPLVAQVTTSALKRLNLTVGQKIWASFKATSLRFIRK